MKRIQRKRTKGWRMPEGAVYVGRPTLWGNPWDGRDVRAFDVPVEDRAAWLVRRYLADIEEGFGLLSDYGGNVSERRWDAAGRAVMATGANNMAEAAVLLRGRDLACWCPEVCGEDVDLGWVEGGGPYDPCTLPRGHAGYHDPSAPAYCHADVLLELANR